MKPDADSHRFFALAGEIEGARRRFLLKDGLNRIGGLRSSDVFLDARGISKRHALLVVQRDHLTVEDLASKNGTWVNGVRVESTRVKPGDELRVGEVSLRIEEIHPDEGELAVAIEKRRQTPDLVFETSRVASRGSGAGRWLRVVDGFVDRLGSEADGQLVSALALLVGELGLRGACVVDLSDRGSPLAVACFGVFEERSLSRLELGDGTDGGRGVKVRHFPGETGGGSPLTVALNPPAPLALALWGELQGRDVEPLLRTLLRLVNRLHPTERPPPATPAVATDRLGLALPPGYVRCESPPMESLYRQMQAVARSDLPILVLGETGAGKEGVAQILHRTSGRRRGPFVAINCAAIPAELLEAELFGIGKGVATGVAERQGKFELAEGGTLLLDEISDMSKELQAKLLRALQEQEIQPVGRSPRPLDVRVVAATNTALPRRIEDGSFRRDLYYRLAGFVLTVPPLRERREDVPALVETFLRAAAKEAGKTIRGITLGAMARLVDRPWPGNVRQLQHEVRRLVFLCPDRQAIDSSMLGEAETDTAAGGGGTAAIDEPAAPGELSGPPAEPAAGLELGSVERLRLAEIEKQVVLEALRRCGGNRTRAAGVLGISREALRRRITRHQLADSP